MAGIDRQLLLDTKHVAKHLPGTPQMQRLLEREGSVHIFKDKETMLRVSARIIEVGEFTGQIRGHDRYGLYFSEAIGDRISEDGTSIPLYYAEIKVKGGRYHVIPRTSPSR